MPATHKPFLLLVLLSLLFFTRPLDLKAQYSKYDTRALLVMNFVKYTTWPSEAFTSPTQKIRLGILGDDPFGTQIERIFQGRPVHGRYWEIVRSKKIIDLWGCHIIYVCNSEKDRIREITDFYTGRAINKKHPVFTIGDNIPDFCKLGGIINFTNDKFNFEINIEAARKQNLIIDANLLRLADRIVSSE